MNRENILKSDVLDIIFENRNKSYGAYDLRKYYGRRLSKAVMVMMGLVLVLAALSFLPKNKILYNVGDYFIPDTKLGNPAEPKKKVKPAILVNKQSAAKQKVWTNNMKIVPDKEKTDSFKTIKPSDQIGIVDRPAILTGGHSAEGLPVFTGGGTADPAAPLIRTIDKNTPLFSADIMPSFPGGMKALHDFLQINLHNPRDMESGDQVNVTLRFVVNYDGKLKGFEILQDGGEEFNQEVVRVLKKMPQWIPGKSNGENVSVYYNIPVKFVPAE